MENYGNEYSDTKRDLTSDFNEAKLQIFRLNNSWERFGTAIRSGRFLEGKGANWELDDIFGELSTDAENMDEDKEEKEKYSYKIKKVDELISKNEDNNDAVYRILRTKERILRRLQDKSGKGSKRSSEDEDDIDT